MRSLAATCLFETARRAEATVFSTRPSLKGPTVDLSFYEPLYASFTPVHTCTYIYKGLQSVDALSTRLLRDRRSSTVAAMPATVEIKGLRSLDSADSARDDDTNSR